MIFSKKEIHKLKHLSTLRLWDVLSALLSVRYEHNCQSIVCGQLFWPGADGCNREKSGDGKYHGMSFFVCFMDVIFWNEFR